MRGDLDWVTMKALEKDRTLRYQTAVAPAQLDRHAERQATRRTATRRAP